MQNQDCASNSILKNILEEAYRLGYSGKATSQEIIAFLTKRLEHDLVVEHK